MSDDAEVWLIRHAESEANASGIWQGQSESDLTARGAEQVEALGRRLQRTVFDLVVSSPLRRARQTAAVIGEAEIDEDLIEVNLGRWEGKTWRELAATDLSELEALGRGEEGRFGEVGESRAGLAARATAAVDRVFARLPAGGRAAVITHGGVLDVVIEQSFGRVNGRRLAGFPENTGVTRVVRRYGHDRIVSFNDTSHLGRRASQVEQALASGRPVVAIVRHARTAANVEGRWQGHSDWGLDDVGLAQAASLAASYPGFDRVVSSPLGRAWQTANHLHESPEPVEDLRELGFGQWEGLTMAEIRLGWPELFERIFVHGEDLARGETGETWSQLAARVRRAFDAVGARAGSVTGVVTHGAAIRSYLASLAGGGWSRSQA
ncbi:MAG: histidine phosphatase family protein, partial [Acidimicrobiia bacterium]|nr:histidine phosphatase family protein [Acidimicrobiia bacterium]